MTKSMQKQSGAWRKLAAIGLIFSLLLPLAAWSAQMNMRDADMRELVEAVSRITGKTMILDPRVKTIKVTVLSQTDMNEEEIYSLFLSILEVHGLAAVESDGVIKILQEQNAKTEPVPVVKGNSQRYSTDSLITKVIRVQNVNAQELFPILRQLVSQQGGHLAGVRGSNIILIHDRAGNVRKIEQLIEDIDRETNEEIEVIALNHASATEIVRIMENLGKRDAQQQGGIVGAEPKFVADERTNSILLSADNRSRLRLRALISQLDTPLSDTGNTRVFYLKYAKAPELSDVLGGVGESIEAEEAKGASPATRGPGNKSFSIEAHEDTNALVITAPPDLMRSFESVIRQLDIRRNQVHVEALIVEISDVKAKELGVQWLFSHGEDDVPVGVFNFNNTGPGIVDLGGAALANRGTDGTSTTVIAPDGTVTTTSTPNVGDNGQALAQVLSGVVGSAIGLGNISKTGFSWVAFIKALGTNTDSNILSQPSLTVLDNEEAEFNVGQEIPIITGSALGDNNSNPFTTVDRKDVGILMKLTPQINEGDAVRLDIEQEVSSIAGTTATDIITNKRKVKTSVLVNDGGMVVLGGLIDDDIQLSGQKVPLLGDIPVLGHLFKSERTQKTKRNLMIFIHPTIIRDDSRMAQISSRKYNYMRGQQIEMQNKGISLMPSETSRVMPRWDESMALPPNFDEFMETEESQEEQD